MSGVGGAAVTYTLARLGLFAAALAVGYLAGLRDLALVVVAALVSMVLSLLVLRRQRDAFAASIAARREQAAAREAVEAERMERAKAEHERKKSEQ